MSPLMSAVIVTRSIPAVCELSHVTDAVSAFLFMDDVRDIPFARACALGSLQLAQRIWASCPEVDRSGNWSRQGSGGYLASLFSSTMEPSKPLDATGEWSLAATLRSDRHYNRDQFAKGATEAATQGNLELLRWMFDHFSDCDIPVEVPQEAARGNHRDVIEFLLEYEKLEDDRRNWFNKPWKDGTLVAAFQAGHNDLVIWMTQHDAIKGSFEAQNLVDAVAQTGDLTRLQEVVESCGRFPGLDFAAESGNIAMLEWLVRQDHTEGKKRALIKASIKGDLDAVRWLVENGFVYFENQVLAAAAENGHLAIVRWLVEKANINGSIALNGAVRGGRMEIAKYLSTKNVANCTSKTMYLAARAGNLEMVKWLYEEFGDTVDLFSPNNCVSAQDKLKVNSALRALAEPSATSYDAAIAGGDTKNPVMDGAAMNGHLPVLVCLREISIAMQTATTPAVGGKRKRETSQEDHEGKTIPVCTEESMELAITGGHIDIALWLRKHYKLEPTANSVDIAAGNGHLRMVQWLLRNSTSGCTTAAMDAAAKMGHFSMVRWLHKNRSEGCTARAVYGAAIGGHFDVLLFLYFQRSEEWELRDEDLKSANGNIIRWCHDNRIGVAMAEVRESREVLLEDGFFLYRPPVAY